MSLMLVTMVFKTKVRLRASFLTTLCFITEEISGIFVKSIAPGSAADISQRIAINDQIIEVDGKSLYGHTNHQAVEVLRHSGSRVQLRVARYLRGAKFNQLQQLVASADATAPPPQAVSERKSSLTSDSVLIQLEQSADLRKSGIRSATNDSDIDLPPPAHSDLLPCMTHVTPDHALLPHENNSKDRLQQKWRQKLGHDFLIIVSICRCLIARH